VAGTHRETHLRSVADTHPERQHLRSAAGARRGDLTARSDARRGVSMLNMTFEALWPDRGVMRMPHTHSPSRSPARGCIDMICRSRKPVRGASEPGTGAAESARTAAGWRRGQPRAERRPGGAKTGRSEDRAERRPDAARTGRSEDRTQRGPDATRTGVDCRRRPQTDDAARTRSGDPPHLRRPTAPQRGRFRTSRSAASRSGWRKP
jgi:hypothetical protein